jgi:hypothetical protein
MTRACATVFLMQLVKHRTVISDECVSRLRVVLRVRRHLTLGSFAGQCLRCDPAYLRRVLLGSVRPSPAFARRVVLQLGERDLRFIVGLDQVLQRDERSHVSAPSLHVGSRIDGDMRGGAPIDQSA